MVPLMIAALADAQSGRPALAGRLKAAVMQLLPPLLDGLHARWLGIQSHRKLGMTRAQEETLDAVLVGPVALPLQAPAHPQPSRLFVSAAQGKIMPMHGLCMQCDALRMRSSCPSPWSACAPRTWKWQ